MKRLALFALVVAIAACGSSTAPTDTFNGNWYGVVDGDSVKITGSQSGHTFTGNGIVFLGADTDTVTFNGTSTPPTLQSTLAFVNQDVSFAFNGRYINADSISGTATSGEESIAFAIGKH
jgi:type 1 fimbria pilin